MSVATHPRLDHLPVEPRHDAPLWGLVTNLPPGAEVPVRASTTDDLGQRWTSESTFRADERGYIDLAADVPLALRAPDAYHCWSSLSLDQSTTPRGMPVSIAASPDIVFADLSPRDYHIDIGENRATTIARRPLVDVDVEEWRGAIVADLLLPTHGRTSEGLAVVLGGSAGGFAWSHQVAGLLATSGRPAVAVAYHDWSGTHGLPSRIELQPLELIEEVVARARKEIGAAGRTVGVGFSKGAEAVLALCARSSALDAVIAVAPSSHVWESARATPDTPARSAWTWQGRPLPYVPLPLAADFYRDFDQRRLHAAHAQGLTSAPANTAIELPRHTPILLISSTADETWPSTSMATTLAQGRSQVHHVQCAEAGHLLLPPGYPTTRAGGTPQANGVADRAMWTAMRDFLDLS